VVAIICLIYSSEIGVIQRHLIVKLLYEIFDNNCYFQGTRGFHYQVGSGPYLSGNDRQRQERDNFSGPSTCFAQQMVQI